MTIRDRVCPSNYYNTQYVQSEPGITSDHDASVASNFQDATKFISRDEDSC